LLGIVDRRFKGFPQIIHALQSGKTSVNRGWVL